jgi:glycosyltransferase involved in cell wall biosynthesis
MHGLYEVMDDAQGNHLKKLMPLVDHWVYVADKNLTPFQRHHLYRHDKFTKISSGLERPVVSPLSKPALNIPEDAFVICVASRALPEKGWLESIQAVDYARKKTGRDIHLLLLGNGPLFDQLSRQQTPAYVHLLGFKFDPVNYYALADLGLLASRYSSECRPLTLMECLMAGRPIVATDIGEIRDMLSTPDGRLAGSLVPLNNWEIPIPDLGAAISALVSDENAYQTAAALAREVAHKFDMNSIVEQYVDVFARASSRRSS